MNGRPVAVTGLGLVSALGTNAKECFEAAISGRQGFRVAPALGLGQRPDLLATIAIGAEEALREKDSALEHLSGVNLRACRADALAVMAAREALRDAGVEDRRTVGVCVGASVGGIPEIEQAVLRSAPRDEVVRAYATRPLSTLASELQSLLGPFADVKTICAACATGTVALAVGHAWVSSGRFDTVLVGGVDVASVLTRSGFGSLKLLAREGCRPFSRDRDGLLLGEAAAFLVLQSPAAVARGRAPRAWLSGTALKSEAHHVTQPEPSGSVAASVLSEALLDASVEPESVDFLAAHATGTPANDAVEARAVNLAFGAHARALRVGATKSLLGHTLAASGTVDAVLTVLALEDGRLPAGSGRSQADPRLGLVLARPGARVSPFRAAMCCSFGFGGNAAAVVFESRERARKPPVPEEPRRRVLVVSSAVTTEREPLLDPTRSRRFDSQTASLTRALELVLEAPPVEAREKVALVVGHAFGNPGRSYRYLERLRDLGAERVSPAEFPHLLPSASASHASIYLGIRGAVITVSELGTTLHAGLALAEDLLQDGRTGEVAVGMAQAEDEVLPEVLGAELVVDRRIGVGLRLRAAPVSGEEAVTRGEEPAVALLTHGQAPPNEPLGLPPCPPDTVVLTASEPEAITSSLAAEGWHAAPLHVQEASGATPEIAAGLAFHAALGILRSGRACHALVVTLGVQWCRFTLLGVVGAPSLPPGSE